MESKFKVGDRVRLKKGAQETTKYSVACDLGMSTERYYRVTLVIKEVYDYDFKYNCGPYKYGISEISTYVEEDDLELVEAPTTMEFEVGDRVRLISEEAFDSYFKRYGEGNNRSTHDVNYLTMFTVKAVGTWVEIEHPNDFRRWCLWSHHLKKVEVIPGAIISDSNDTYYRNNQGKPRVDLLPVGGLGLIAKVFEESQKANPNYAPDPKTHMHNWMKSADEKSILASLFRHLIARFSGENLDKQTGQSHVAHIGANVLILLHHIQAGSLIQNVYIKPKEEASEQ